LLLTRPFAKALWVSQPAIAKLESGQTHNFSLETLVKLAVALECELEVRFHPLSAKAA
jgi:predicted XRE-type DNA-binding protein